MKSSLRLMFCVFGLLAVQGLRGAEGVQFYLGPVGTKTGDQATCGVLHCSEEVQPGSRISSLTVYKQEAGIQVLLATVSPERAIDNGTSIGAEVDGLWTPEKAEVKLYLVDEDDCTKGQFICKVGFTDEQEIQRSSVAVLDGEGTTSEMTEDTPPPSSDGKGKNETLVKDDTSVKGPSERDTRSISVRVLPMEGGWIVIQRRDSRSTNFHRNWADYKKGFGSYKKAFWLGNEKVHQLTTSAPYKLRVTLEKNGKMYYANYDRFYIDGEEDNYKLHIGKYSGTAGDSLRKNNNMMFSTYDRDNDGLSRHINCAVKADGAWWYDFCGYSNLNGFWYGIFYNGPYWYTLNRWDRLTFTEMKIRII